MESRSIGLSKFWLGVLLVGSSLSGWILTSYKVIWFGWIVVVSGIWLGTVAGLLDGLLARTVLRRKQQLLDRATVIGLKAGLVAGLIAGLVVWVFVLSGLKLFIENGPDASWSVSWFSGLTVVTSATGSSGTIPWPLFLFIVIMAAVTEPVKFPATLYDLSTTCSRAAASSNNHIVVLGSYYFSILGTLAAAVIAIAVAITVALTVAKTKVLVPGFSQQEVRSLWTVTIIAGTGLALGWIVDKILLPGFGEQLARLSKQC